GAGLFRIMSPASLPGAGHLAAALHDGGVELVLGPGVFVLPAVSREHEPQAPPPLGYTAVFLPRLLFGRALVGKGAALGLEVALDRGPDVLELVLGERWWKREFMRLVELIEKLVLEHLTAEPGMLLLEACFVRRLQLVERFQPQRFCKRIGDGDRARRFNRFHRHVELGRLACKFRVRLVGWKG